MVSRTVGGSSPSMVSRSAPVAAPLPRQSEKRTMDRPAPHIQRTTLTRGAPGVEPLRSACIEPLHHACMLAGQ